MKTLEINVLNSWEFNTQECDKGGSLLLADGPGDIAEYSGFICTHVSQVRLKENWF